MDMDCIYNRLLGFGLLAGILCMVTVKSTAQASLMGGLNISGIRNDNLLENEKVSAGFHVGWAFRVYPFRRLPDFSIQSKTKDH